MVEEIEEIGFEELKAVVDDAELLISRELVKMEEASEEPIMPAVVPVGLSLTTNNYRCVTRIKRGRVKFHCGREKGWRFRGTLTVFGLPWPFPVEIELEFERWDFDRKRWFHWKARTTKTGLFSGSYSVKQRLPSYDIFTTITKWWVFKVRPSWGAYTVKAFYNGTRSDTLWVIVFNKAAIDIWRKVRKEHPCDYVARLKCR